MPSQTVQKLTILIRLTKQTSCKTQARLSRSILTACVWNKRGAVQSAALETSKGLNSSVHKAEELPAPDQREL